VLSFWKAYQYVTEKSGKVGEVWSSINLPNLVPLSFNLDKRHVTRYNFVVIKTFADKHTQELFETGKSKRMPPDLIKRAIRRLEYVALATCLKDLEVPPSNRLHPLKGRRKGQYSISVNDQWRICFRFIDEDAYDVEITDYH